MMETPGSSEMVVAVHQHGVTDRVGSSGNAADLLWRFLPRISAGKSALLTCFRGFPHFKPRLVPHSFQLINSLPFDALQYGLSVAN